MVHTHKEIKGEIMSLPFMGEMSFFANNFAPRDWTFCNGQLLSIGQFQALYAVIGTNFGGDGRTTFGMPNMKGRAPLHWGQAPGLSSFQIGAMHGYNSITLLQSEIPEHTHSVYMLAAKGSKATPDSSNDFLSIAVKQDNTLIKMYNALSNPTQMNENTLSSQGQSTAHLNVQPSLAMNCYIAFDGIFPSRN